MTSSVVVLSVCLSVCRHSPLAVGGGRRIRVSSLTSSRFCCFSLLQQQGHDRQREHHTLSVKEEEGSRPPKICGFCSRVCVSELVHVLLQPVVALQQVHVPLLHPASPVTRTTTPHHRHTTTSVRPCHGPDDHGCSLPGCQEDEKRCNTDLVVSVVKALRNSACHVVASRQPRSWLPALPLPPHSLRVLLPARPSPAAVAPVP